MKLFWQIGNILTLIFALVANFLVGAQILVLPAINEISDKYATLLTPASYAFSIWSIIYVFLVIFVIYQARDLFRPKANNSLPQRIGPFFIIASIANGLWTFVFVNEWIVASVGILLILTVSLYILIFKLKIALHDAPVSVVVCVWWPLLLYAGWVTVATIVNSASWLQSVDIAISPFAACAVLAILGGLLIALLIERNVRELLIASAWGIAAIGVQLWQTDGDTFVMIAAITVASSLLIAVGIHAFIHRKATVFSRIIRQVR